MRFEFGVLGSMEVARDGETIPLGAGMSRTILGALLLEANRTVSVDQLIETLWSGRPPASATASLHNHIMRLRRLLASTSAEDGDRIRAVSPGYVIEIHEGELDLDTFTVLCARARTSREREDWPAVRRDLTEALTLWRGEPFADLNLGKHYAGKVQRLTEQRFEALNWRIEADLRTGRHQELIPELSALITEYPLREAFHGQLMLALHQAGRQAEAVKVYEDLSEALIENLGIEPSRTIQAVHGRILAGEPQPPELPERPRPSQLPADIFDFAGREEQIAQLRQGLATAVCAIIGPGGVGKTALAVHTAHQVRGAAADGQLYVNLRGSDQRPLAAADVLIRLLRDLGVDGQAVPVDEAERAAMYRSRLAGRRMLLLFDDARDAAQLRPLLPGTATCQVLITSRNRLSGLDGCRIFDLDVLDAGESFDLMARIVGRERVDAEPDATTDVIKACAGLPLAIRIAAARLRARPAWTVGYLASRLSAQEQRLHELRTDDLAVRASFAMSYANLDPQTPGLARAFRLLGLWEGQDISATAAASLLAEPPTETEQALEALVDVHLLTASAPGRYQLHDLLRLYAKECAGDEESAEDRAAALKRLLMWYLATAEAAGFAQDPGMVRVEIGDLHPMTRPLAFGDHGSALAWCEQERANLVTVVEQAATTGEDKIAWRVAAVLWPFFIQHSHWAEWLRTSELGLRGARALGDLVAEGRMLRSLAGPYYLLEQYDEATSVMKEALKVAREIGDEKGISSALNNLGGLHMQGGRLQEALVSYREALEIDRRLDEPTQVAIVLNNLADALLSSSDLAEAAEYAEQAITISHALQDRHTEGISLLTYGEVLYRMREYERAERAFQDALVVTREMADRYNEAGAMRSVGQLLIDSGRRAEGIKTLRECHALLMELGDPRAADVEARLAAVE